MTSLRTFHTKVILRVKISFQRTVMAKSTSATKPTIWLHGPIEEDVLVGFRKEQMQMIHEHFNVVTYKQFKESNTSSPFIVGMSFVCLFSQKSKIITGLFYTSILLLHLLHRFALTPRD